MVAVYYSLQKEKDKEYLNPRERDVLIDYNFFLLIGDFEMFFYFFFPTMRSKIIFN